MVGLSRLGVRVQRQWGSDLWHVLDHLWDSFGPILREIKPSHGLRETQVRVDTGNDNACVYGEQFDAYKETRT